MRLADELSEDEDVPADKRGAAGQSAPPNGSTEKRRMSVAVDGVSHVAALGEETARAMGLVAERVFDVSQHQPKKRDIQLKVGGMGLTLFQGPKPLESFIYKMISDCTMSPSGDVLSFSVYNGSKTKSYKMKSDNVKTILQLMDNHRKAAGISAERAIKKQGGSMPMAADTGVEVCFSAPGPLGLVWRKDPVSGGAVISRVKPDSQAVQFEQKLHEGLRLKSLNGSSVLGEAYEAVLQNIKTQRPLTLVFDAPAADSPRAPPAAAAAATAMTKPTQQPRPKPRRRFSISQGGSSSPSQAAVSPGTTRRRFSISHTSLPAQPPPKPDIGAIEKHVEKCIEDVVLARTILATEPAMQEQVSSLEADFHTALQEVPDLARRAMFVEQLKAAVSRSEIDTRQVSVEDQQQAVLDAERLMDMLNEEGDARSASAAAGAGGEG